MIPVRLNLRNFMCYTDVHQPLVFDGIDVACLSGANGHGKSALLDAITWALWGRSRARRDNDLIHLAPGRNDMEVEFEFRLGTEQFRVIRKRTRVGAGRSMLEFTIKEPDSGEYRPLSGNNLRETELLIEQRLRMSYETFTNSSFILQGRADAFTTRTPTERKQVLAEILDLSYYDRLEDRAKRKASERNEQQGVLSQQIRDDDAELLQQPELGEQKQALEAELERLEERLKLAEARSETLRERLGRLREGERELREQERRLGDARGRADRYRVQAAAAQAALERAHTVIDREAQIEQGYADLAERRGELEQLALAQAEHGRLSYEAACLQRIIAQGRGQLEGRLSQLKGQLGASGVEAGLLEQYVAELAAAGVERDQLHELEQRRAALEARRTEARERYSALKAHHEQHQSRLVEVREYRELLGTSPTCPVCQTALGSDRHRQVLQQYRQDEERITDLARRAEGEQREVFELGTSLKNELAELERQLGRRKQNQERLAKAERAVARAQEQARTIEALKAEAQQAEAALSANDYAHQERGDLVRLERQILGLGYDPNGHKSVAAAANELTRYESLRQDLLEARRSLGREQAAKDEAERGLTEWETEQRAADKRRTELLAETKDLPAVEAESGAAEADLRTQRLDLGRLNQELGGVRQRLNTMEFIAQRRDERRAELERVLVERSIYQQLAEAFGKRGLQADLIDTAIPEIEDDANRLLAQMTDGRMHVSFKTQRQTQGGDTVETLDININDELGVRPYEMYSGGEAFRVNFAIRIALSKLLARRAGAKLQTLVIDEGFGSQDDQGRDRLIDAIRTIQSEFEKIIIITHLSDFKDAFPTRIEVTKTAAGSIIEVN